MEDKYAKNLLNCIDTLSYGLRYYIDRTHKLETENKVLSEMYENSVNERLKRIKNETN